MRSGVPSLVMCLWAVALWHGRSRLLGLRRSVRAVQRMGVAARPGRGVEGGLVEETARRVATAAAFFPGRALCLEQSLALCALLRQRGVAAELRLGVQTMPFKAHAWVEVEGCAVNERDDVARTFVPFRLAEV